MFANVGHWGADSDNQKSKGYSQRAFKMCLLPLIVLTCKTVNWNLIWKFSRGSATVKVVCCILKNLSATFFGELVSRARSLFYCCFEQGSENQSQGTVTICFWVLFVWLSLLRSQRGQSLMSDWTSSPRSLGVFVSLFWKLLGAFISVSYSIVLWQHLFY